MRLLEHGDERTYVPLTETRMPGLERAMELEREIAVSPGQAGAGRRRHRDRVHDVARNGNDLAVEGELDHLPYLPFGLKA